MQSPPRARIPPALALAAILSALLIGGACLAWLAWQFAMLPPLMALAIRVAVFVLPIGGAIEAGWIAWRRYADHRYIAAAHQAAIERARVQVAPLATSYHHAPQIHHAPEAAPNVIDVTPQAPALPPGVPTFVELLDSGRIGQGRPLILGFDAATGQAIEGTWSKLYSVGLGGMTGSGKTTTAAFLLGQSVAASKAKLIVIDPHAGDDESLSDRIAGLSAAYRCDVAQSPPQIESALKLAATMLAQRIAGTPASEPLILVCDEWTSLLRGRLGELLTSVALDFAEQGRKYGCFGMFCAQAWQIEAAGPVRDRLASHFTMRTRGDQFRYQMGLRGSAPLDTLFLQPGQAYFLSVAGDLLKVIIPKTEASDLARIGAMLDTPALVSGHPFGFAPASALAITPSAQATGQATAAPPMVATGKPDGSLMVACDDQATTASGRASPLSPDAARVRDLLHAGNNLPAIVYELRGIKSSEGRRYQTALAEITDLLREVVP